MNSVLYHLLRALARLVESEPGSGSGGFLPNGRQAHLLYGKMFSEIERKGTTELQRRKPEILPLSATRCQSSLRSRRMAQDATAR